MESAAWDIIGLGLTILLLLVGGAIGVFKALGTLESIEKRQRKMVKALRQDIKDGRTAATEEHNQLMERIREDSKQSWERHSKTLEKMDASMKADSEHHQHIREAVVELAAIIKRAKK